MTKQIKQLKNKINELYNKIRKLEQSLLKEQFSFLIKNKAFNKLKWKINIEKKYIEPINYNKHSILSKFQKDWHEYYTFEEATLIYSDYDMWLSFYTEKEMFDFIQKYKLKIDLSDLETNIKNLKKEITDKEKLLNKLNNYVEIKK